MNITKEFKNDMMKRKEITGVLQSAKNPSYAEVLKMVSEKTNSPEENIVVTRVKGNFGTDKFLIEARVYNSKEDKEKIEPKAKAKKGAAA